MNIFYISEGTHIWNKLPENTQEIISPYLHSKYYIHYMCIYLEAVVDILP